MIGKWLLIIVFFNGHFSSGASMQWFDTESDCHTAIKEVKSMVSMSRDPSMKCKFFPKEQ